MILKQRLNQELQQGAAPPIRAFHEERAPHLPLASALFYAIGQLFWQLGQTGRKVSQATLCFQGHSRHDLEPDLYSAGLGCRLCWRSSGAKVYGGDWQELQDGPESIYKNT